MLEPLRNPYKYEYDFVFVYSNTVACGRYWNISNFVWAVSLMAQCVRVVEMSLEDEEVEIILTLSCASVTAFLATHSTSNRNVKENILMQLRYARATVLFHMMIRCR